MHVDVTVTVQVHADVHVDVTVNVNVNVTDLTDYMGGGPPRGRGAAELGSSEGPLPRSGRGHQL